jgi:putative DNA primase/helicase
MTARSNLGPPAVPGAELDLAAIPAELRALAQWVVWRYEHRDAKPTKVPCCPAMGARASSTDPTTWTTFEEAVEAWRQGGYVGVGFVFGKTNPYCGIDLDDCVDGAGEVSADAAQIVHRLNTYTEISPSGRGVKLFLRGKLPARGRRKGKVEMYDCGRFFTVTGRHLAGTPTTVEERQAELDALHAEMFGTPPPTSPLSTPEVSVGLDDDQLLEKARQAKNGAKFVALYDRGDIGAYGNDDSVADLALCGMLAFWSGSDPVRMDGLFRRSALMRPKWDEKRGDSTYGGITLAKALATTTEFFGSRQPAPPSRADQDEALRELCRRR